MSAVTDWRAARQLFAFCLRSEASETSPAPLFHILWIRAVKRGCAQSKTDHTRKSFRSSKGMQNALGACPASLNTSCKAVDSPLNQSSAAVRLLYKVSWHLHLARTILGSSLSQEARAGPSKQTSKAAQFPKKSKESAATGFNIVHLRRLCQAFRL